MRDFIIQKKLDSIYYKKSITTTTTSPLYSHKYKKKWYWWQLLFLVIGCIALLEFKIILFNNYFSSSSSFRIDIRQYPKINYQHIEQTPFPSTTWPNKTNVYHVTKEFGPATLGGLGVLLTAMTKKQQRSGYINTNVILPYYSFIKKNKRKTDDIKKIADLVIYVKNIHPKKSFTSSLSSSSSSSSAPVSFYSNNQHSTSSTSSLFSGLSSSSQSPKSSSMLYSSSHSSSSSSSFSSAFTSSATSFLFPPYTTENEENDWIPVEFSVSRWKYLVSHPPPSVKYDTWYIDDNGHNKTLQADKRRPPLRSDYIYVYLIGPGKQKPLNKLFKSSDATQVYSMSDELLSSEWRDQFFSKATATFLSYQASKTRHDQSLFAPANDFISPSSGIDVVHIHGATNAYLSHYLKDPTLWNTALSQPAIVYTLHDYSDEFRYSNSLQNIQSFDPNPPLFPSLLNQKINKKTKSTFSNSPSSSLSPQLYFQQQHRQQPVLNNYTFYKDKLFTSSLGIELADIVTFVSKSMVLDMVNGQVDFQFKELTMDSILRKIEKKQLFGISNGANYRPIHPFKHQKLRRAKIAYPTYAWDQLSTNHQIPSPTNNSLMLKTPYTLSDNINDDHIASHKKKAKRWLIRKNFLSQEDEHRPLVLFIGRFQYNKGLASFERAIQEFKNQDMKLIMFGSPNDYPLEKVLALGKKYRGHVMIHTTKEEQEQWLIYCRAAADFVFVPSITESFGLVAAEGLMFGAPVISTGAGGLGEFLKNRPSPILSRTGNKNGNENEIISPTAAENYMNQPYNAYLYDLVKPKEHEQSMEMAIQQAAQDYHYLLKHRLEREQFLLHTIDSALALSWQTPHRETTGPLFDYFRVYDLAIQYQYNQSHAMINKNPKLF